MKKSINKFFSIMAILGLMIMSFPFAPIAQATSSAKSIYQFTFVYGTNNSQLVNTMSGIVDESAKTILVNVPSGTDVTILKPTIYTTSTKSPSSSRVSPASGVVQNFTSPVVYTVTAADDSTVAYTVTVVPVSNTDKAITKLKFNNPLTNGIINESAKTITVYVPHGTIMDRDDDDYSLFADVAIKGKSVLPKLGAYYEDYTVPVTYTVTAGDNSTQQYVVTVVVATDTATVSTPQVTVTASAVVWVNSAVTNPTIDVSSLVTDGTGTLPQITIVSDLANIAIPADTVVTGAGWDGILTAPTVATVTLPAGSDLGTAISIGFPGNTLTFSKAVRMLFPDNGGKRVGYTTDGVTDFTEITADCGTDDQTAVDALLAGDEDGNCKMDVGDDLVVWTKHFTDYYTYTSSSDVETEADVDNVVPVASGVAINGTDAWIDLTENTTTPVIVTATVTDNNGCVDIESVSVKFYETTEGATGADENNYRYTAAATQLTCVGLVATYTASIPVYFYANPGEWTATVTPSDEEAGTSDDDTIQMATLVAVDVSTPISYGSLALNEITGDTTAFDATITNTGNSAAIGVQVKSGASTAMGCDIGTIPVGNEKYHATSTTPYASKTALKATDETVAGVSAAKTTNGTTGNTDTIGWGLQMPASGVGGSCSGTVVFTPII